MTYKEALLSCTGPNDIVAILYGDDIETSYVKITLGDRQSILKYLVQSDGRAVSIVLKNTRYWLLLSSYNSNALLYRGPNEKKLFNNILESDMVVAEYLKML